MEDGTETKSTVIEQHGVQVQPLVEDVKSLDVAEQKGQDTVTLVSMDEQRFVVGKKEAFIAQLVKQALETGHSQWQRTRRHTNRHNGYTHTHTTDRERARDRESMSGCTCSGLDFFVCVDETATEIPIPGVKASIMMLVINYMNHHAGVEPPIIEKPLRSKIMKEVCKDKWDADYIDTIADDRQTLYDLILVCVTCFFFLFFCVYVLLAGGVKSPAC